MIKIIKKILGIKDKEIPLPREFIIIDFSSVAKQKGVKDDFNKLIYLYKVDKFGNRVVERMRYNPARVHILKNTRKIPVFDKTKKEDRFPIFDKILPSEIEFSV